jgi:hypothetical protein
LKKKDQKNDQTFLEVSVTEIDLEMHALVMVNQSTCTKKDVYISCYLFEAPDYEKKLLSAHANISQNAMSTRAVSLN